jgi:hypothetical protein
LSLARKFFVSPIPWPRAQHLKFGTSDVADLRYSTDVSSAMIHTASTTIAQDANDSDTRAPGH